MQEREKKDYLILKRMNSCSSNSRNDCLSASVFHSNGKTALMRFCEFFAIFRFFIRFVKSTVSALKIQIHLYLKIKGQNTTIQ
jgi:hypothetical protein